jgi:hypothetical protein
MHLRTKLISILLLAAAGGLALAVPLAAQDNNAQAAAAMAEQRAAIAKLAFLDGQWRGDSEARGQAGTIRMTQTERVGNLLGGTVKLVEGRGYDAEGKTLFNALGMISWDIAGQRYVMRSHTGGRYGEFTIKLLEGGTGFTWEIPMGPAKVAYRMELVEGRWIETGDYIAAQGPARRFVTMKLERIGDTSWPQDGTVPFK